MNGGSFQHMYSNPPALPPGYGYAPQQQIGYGSIGGEAEEMLQELAVSGQEEIVGYGSIGQPQEEIVGYSGYYSSPEEDMVSAEEIIGAMAPTAAKTAALARIRAARAKSAAAKPLAKPMAPALPVQGTRVDVMPQINRRHRLMVAGMGFTVVLLGGIATITIAPQRLFKPKLLSIPGSIALYFAITGVFVGQDSQLAAAGAIPCECFAETAVNAPIDWDTANIGNTITLNIQNIEPAGGAPSRIFSGMIIGLGVKP